MVSRHGWENRWHALRRLPDRVPLRVKLITAVLALVGIALAAISIAGISYLRTYLLNQTDIALQTAAPGYVTGVVQRCLNGDLQCPSFTVPGTAIYFLPEDGRLQKVWIPARGVLGPGARARAQPEPAIQPALHWLVNHPGKPTTLPAESGSRRWRVIAYPDEPFTQAGPIPGDIIMGLDVTSVYNTAARLVSIDLIVSTIIEFALAIVGVAIVRASLRPLTDIEHTAQAIAAGDLGRRVPDHDPRTEVGRLGRALNAMLAQIETAFHARAQSEAAARRSEEKMRQFVADASHELRTPLTTIRGYAEYYRQRGGLANGAAAASQAAGGPASRPAAGPAPAGAAATHLTRVDMDRIMDRVEQESSRMGGMVEDMLLLARLDQQRPIELRPVDLLSLAADAVQDARMVAPDRKIGLTVGSGTAFLVQGDEAKLRQVVGNLMGNALNHTPAGSPIDVRVLAGSDGAAPGADGAAGYPARTVILEVADQGPGLTTEQADRVFERFYRADQARGRRTGGTGLGLAIVSALVSAHGGTVAVDSAPGKGSTFRITLPLAPEAQAAQASG